MTPDPPVLEPRDPDPFSHRKWLIVLTVAALTAGILGYLQYRWSMDVLYACYDEGPANWPVERRINGWEPAGEMLVSAFMAFAIFAITLITYAVPKAKMLIALLVMVVVGLGLLWWGVGSMTTDRCPSGIPPTWPTWLPL